MVKYYLLGIFSFLALSCEIFIPPLPSYLPHVVAVADLDKLLDSKQATWATPVSASILSPHLGVDRVTILLSQATTKSLLTMKRTSLSESLRLVPISGGNFTAYLGTYSQGWKSGNLIFRLDSENPISIDNVLHTISSNPTEPRIANVFYDSSSSKIFSFEFFGYALVYSLTIDYLDDDINNLGTQEANWDYSTLELSYTGNAADSLLFLQAIRYQLPDHIALLAVNKFTNVGSVALFKFDYPNPSANPTFIKILRKDFPTRFDNPDRRYTWLTEAGVVHFDQFDKSVTFYPFEDTAVIPFEIDDLEPLGFSEKGTEWLGYDRLSKKLYLLRSWW